MRADSILDRMRTRQFSNFDYGTYLITMWYNDYFNYPFVIRVSIITILLCCISMTGFMVSVAINKMSEHNRLKEYHNLYKRFYNLFADIMTDKREIPFSEINERLELTPADIKQRKNSKSMFVGCQLLIQVKADHFNEYNYENVRSLCHALGVHAFLERMLVFGSRTQRRRALQTAQFLMVNLPESVLVRLLNSVSPVLRKETRMYYLWLSDYNPFRFFQELSGARYEWHEWDGLEIHFLMSARFAAHKEMPSLPPVIAECENERLQACLIREVGFWGTPEDVDNMKKYLGYKSPVIRQAAIECLIQARATTSEPMLMAAYAHQSEHLRLYILRALVLFKTGKAIPFFLKAYKESKVQSTKLNILMALSMYNEQSKAEFKRLEAECSIPEDQSLFAQVRVFDDYIKSLAQ